MTLCRLAVLIGFVLVAGSLAVHAEDKPEDYLAKDGSLQKELLIKDLQGGFAGFTGKAWSVQPNGDWAVSTVFNQKLTVESKGTLTKDQLAKLARELARYGLSSLETKNEGKPAANPHNVSIKWGKRETILTLDTGSSLPKPDKTGTGGRYAGIAAAVAELLEAPK